MEGTTALQIHLSLQSTLEFVNTTACLTDRWEFGGKYKRNGCRRKRNILKEMCNGLMNRLISVSSVQNGNCPLISLLGY
jgi:hypothetical protein